MPATATLSKPASSATASAKVSMLTPHLVCRNANKAIEFYKRAFGAEEMRVIRMPDGTIMHAALTIGGAMVFLAEEFPQCGSRSPEALSGTPVTLHLHVSDCDAVFNRAVEAGCTAKMPPQDMFWGDRYAVITDPFGHAWSIGAQVRQVSDGEIQQAAAACSEKMKAMSEGRR